MPQISRTNSFSWSHVDALRQQVRAKWPRIHRLPLTARSTRFAAARIAPGERVLDVGGSSGRFGKRIPEARYQTLDIDPEVHADYRSLDEVEPGSIDVVTSFEMLEHLTLPEARAVLAGIARVLKPGGRLYLSTPNIHHPWSYLRSATHVTPFCYDELGAFVLDAGLSLDGLWRCNRDSVLKGMVRFLARPLYLLTGIDYAKSILVAAHRPLDATNRPRVEGMPRPSPEK